MNTHHVIATAGHVDHGKSALVLRLTGTDPDRFAEEKRRGLTIDLGFAWLTLPSGNEIGFVDVPGHERFVGNMLAGVGPVRLVLFVVAADEGWKPQTEEHLGILDLLGVDGAVVALTKCDLVDDDALAATRADVGQRLQGTALEGAPTVACSSRSGTGISDLLTALDAMVIAASAAEVDRSGRARQFIDRVFTIKGAGTVVTGTLTGGSLAVGDEVEVLPAGTRGRIRGLQSHKRSLDRAQPVSRVAVNLAAAEREQLGRGDVLVRPGQWRPTTTFEAAVRPIRGLDRDLSSRGAFKLYAGSAERDARVRLYPGRTDDDDDDEMLVRVRTSEPVVLDVFDRFVLREAGRRETVAGGIVLDIEPPLRPGSHVDQRLGARRHANREDLPSLLVAERGAVRASDVLPLTGTTADEIRAAARFGEWWLSDAVRDDLVTAITSALTAFHADNPLKDGADLSFVRTAAADRSTRRRMPADTDLIGALIDAMTAAGILARNGSIVRLTSHRVVTVDADIARLVAALEATPATPPTVAELQKLGFGRDLIDAAANSGALVRVSRELVMATGFVRDAEAAIRTLGQGGEEITVSAFRERVGTSRKYAVPLLESFDARGITLRRGNARVLRSPS